MAQRRQHRRGDRFGRERQNVRQRVLQGASIPSTERSRSADVDDLHDGRGGIIARRKVSGDRRRHVVRHERPRPTLVSPSHATRAGPGGVLSPGRRGPRKTVLSRDARARRATPGRRYSTIPSRPVCLCSFILSRRNRTRKLERPTNNDCGIISTGFFMFLFFPRRSFFTRDTRVRTESRPSRAAPKEKRKKIIRNPLDVVVLYLFFFFLTHVSRIESPFDRVTVIIYAQYSNPLAHKQTPGPRVSVILMLYTE